jgi:hypothetical protein
VKIFTNFLVDLPGTWLDSGHHDDCVDSILQVSLLHSPVLLKVMASSSSPGIQGFSGFSAALRKFHPVSFTIKCNYFAAAKQ